MKQIEITREMKIILDTFNNAGFECFIVGGCVRDFLLGKKPNDIDFATNATPQQTKKCFYNFQIVETGIKHGTLTVIINHIPFEITTYKTGSLISNNTKLNNSVPNIKEDLSHRDFTINSIAYNLSIGFVDFFGGMQDLKNGIIRCVNNPIERFKEDALRILRALRLAAVLNYKIEKETKDACKKFAYLLKDVAAERIMAELFKTILSPNGHNIIFDYIDVWGVVIPELLKIKGFKQYNPHHIHDVLKHTCVALENADKDLFVCLAILFHDIGKPDTFTLDENGIGHFYGHAAKSVEITKKILNRLRVDNYTQKQVLKLIKFHDLDLQPTKKSMRKLCYKLGDLNLVKKLILVQRADNWGQTMLHTEKFDKIDEIILQLEQENLSFTLKDLDIDGNDLMDLGIIGKEIGKTLKYLLDAVLNEQVINKKQALLDYLNKNN